MIEIKNIHGRVIHTSERSTYSGAVEEALKKGISLNDADFSMQSLKGIRFLEINIRDALFFNTLISDVYFSCTLDSCRFEGCALDLVFFEGAEVKNCAFYRNRNASRFVDCAISRSLFLFEDLKNGAFSKCTFDRCSMAGVSSDSYTFGHDKYVITGGTRSDGHTFSLVKLDDNPPRVTAGCRNFSVAEALEHWSRAERGIYYCEEEDEPDEEGRRCLEDESLAIVESMIKQACARGYDVYEGE